MNRLPVRINYAQPMNVKHPLNKGVRVWWKSLPSLSGAVLIADLAGSRYPASLANHTWASGAPFGLQTAVPNYSSSALSIANTVFNQDSTTRTFSFWFYRTGAGGLNDGYIISKRTSGNPETQSIDLGSTTNSLGFAHGWTTAGGQWHITSPTIKEWHFATVTYDGSLTTNDPLMYLDGVSQAVTEDVAPSGTLKINTDNYTIGNQAGTFPAGASTGFDGLIDDVRIYDRILTPGEIYQLYQATKLQYSPLLNWKWRIPLSRAAIAQYLRNAALDGLDSSGHFFGDSLSRF